MASEYHHPLGILAGSIQVASQVERDIVERDGGIVKDDCGGDTEGVQVEQWLIHWQKVQCVRRGGKIR